jgi:hypothetical protein
MIAATILAHHVTSPAGQAALARHRQHHPGLQNNEHLTDDTWTAVWNADRGYGQIIMTRIPLPAHRLEHVLTPRRIPADLLASILTHQDLTDAQAQRILTSPSLRRPAVTYWLTSGRYPASVEQDLLERLHPGHRAAFEVVSPHLFNQDRMLELLRDATGRHRVQFADELAVHPNAGPGVIDAARAVLAEGGGWERGSRRARRAITRPWSQVDTPSELLLLAGLDPLRIPHVTAARLAALRTGHAYENEHDKWLAASVDDPDPLARLTTPAASLHQALTAGRRLEHLLDQAGAGAWDIAATLLAEQYPGSVDELARTAGALAHDPSGEDIPAPAAVPATTTRRRVTAASRPAGDANSRAKTGRT